MKYLTCSLQNASNFALRGRNVKSGVDDAVAVSRGLLKFIFFSIPLTLMDLCGACFHEPVNGILLIRKRSDVRTAIHTDRFKEFICPEIDFSMP